MAQRIKPYRNHFVHWLHHPLACPLDCPGERKEPDA